MREYAYDLTVAAPAADMVDVADYFLFDLRRLGWRTGRRLVGATRAPAVLSTRKFDRYGDWHYFTMPFRILWEAMRGRDATARRYWYGDR